LFLGFLVVPWITAIAYFGAIASPQYMTEIKFIVHSGDGQRLDGLGLVTGLPSANVVQDTQVISHYIQSRAIVEKLQAKLNLRLMYGDSSIDWPARFNRSRSLEKLVDYWEGKTDVSIQLPGGIVTVTIKAFQAEDALQLGAAVVEFSEELANEMSKRMLADSVSSSAQDFDRAGQRLALIRGEFEAARNAEGMIDPGLANKSLLELVTKLKGDRLRLQQEYDSITKSLSKDAPPVRALNVRIEAISEQIKDLEGRMAGLEVRSHKRISEAMTRFSELELERRIAEKEYASAAAALSRARATAERKLVYLQVFEQPSLPQEARYPKRTLSILAICACSFLLWAMTLGLASLARNHMA
jgi:capsular polysaccharide transport system permease protein